MNVVERYRSSSQTDRLRHLAFIRSRCQAKFRQEQWLLTYEDFCEFWPDNLWHQRGKHPDCLCLVRYDPDGAWSRSNTVQITRRLQLDIKNKRMYNIDASSMFEEARWLE